MKAGFSIKSILYFAPNCPQKIVAPNCPTPNCPRRIVRAELSAPNCPAPNGPDTLGSPLMPGPAVDMVLNKKVEDLERAVGRLSMLHSHDALILLRNGLSVPKLLYTMRTALCVDHPS